MKEFFCLLIQFVCAVVSIAGLAALLVIVGKWANHWTP